MNGIKHISDVRMLTSLMALSAMAVMASCTKYTLPQTSPSDDEGYAHVEIDGTKAGGDYTSTTYRIIIYGQPDQTKPDQLLYVTEGSYCSPKGVTASGVNHTWLTPCKVKESLTADGNHQYVYDGEDVQAGVVFMHNAQYTGSDGKKHYYSYNQNAYKMVIASSAVPVTKYEVTPEGGEAESRQALVIRRDIGDGDKVAVSGLRDITISSSYAGGSYVYSVPSTVMYEHRARLMVQISCDPLIEGGAQVTAVRMSDVLEEAYYNPVSGLYDKDTGQIYTSEPILFKEIGKRQMPADDPIVAYSGDDVYLISKDYSETKIDDQGNVVSACIYPELEVCIGAAWVKVPLDVRMEPQHNYLLKVVINKVHVTAEMVVLPWEVMEPASGTLDEYPTYKLGTVSIGQWDDAAGGPATIDGLTPGQVYGTDDSGKDPWDDNGNSDSSVDNQHDDSNVTGKGGNTSIPEWENGGGGSGEI